MTLVEWDSPLEHLTEVFLFKGEFMIIPAGSFPVLPLKNTVLYPGVTQALRVGRDKSVRAVDLAQQKNNWILTLSQKNPDHTVENIDDLNDIGTLCKIESIKSASDAGYFIVVRGYYRVRVSSYKSESDIFEAFVERLDDMMDMDRITENALLTTLKSISKEVLELVPGNTESVQEIIDVIDDISLLSYMAAANAEISMLDKQKILEIILLKVVSCIC